MHYKQVYLNKTIADLKQYNILSYKDENGDIKEQKISNYNKFNKISESLEEGYCHKSDKRIEDDGFLNDFAGFMPLRRDFEIEYENDIENYLADLEFYDDDRPEDIAIKLKQLEVYLKVLNEREERKDFVMNR